MKQSHWLLCVAKNFDWSKKITPLSNLTRASLLVEWKLTAKAELNCEIYKSLRNCWKSQVSFCHQSSPVCRKAWTLLWISQEFKNTLGKVAVAVNTGGHSIRVLNERSVSDGGNLRSLWLEILNHYDIVSETLYGCETVIRELWLAIVCSLLCPETDWNVRIGKQGYIFILTDFKKWCFDCSFLTSISVPTIIVRLGKVEFFNKFISETFCLLGLLNLRWSNGSWLTKQTNFVLG